MVKVISFSLWDSKKIYNVGAVKNVDLAKKFYPDFECWFYIHTETVPQDIIDKLSEKDNVKIILKSGDLTKIKPMMWRFEAIDDPNVEIMMSRDLDTRILLREKLAVDEWLSSDKIFHIMRDHPNHNWVILGGMFGIKKNNFINIKNLSAKFNQTGIKMYDQDFLRDYIYPLIKDNCMIHSTFNRFEKNNCLDFPIKYDSDFRFVGEYVYEDETRCVPHINIIKDYYEKIRDQIHIVTSFYISNFESGKNNDRNNELQTCLKNNLDHPLIEKVHLFIDNTEALEYIQKLNNPKIVIISVGVKPLYSDLFDYANTKLNDKICMITNSDIYLHKYDINVLNKLNNSNIVFALSRYEYDFSCIQIENFVGSHDSFLFRSPVNIDIDSIKHYQNVLGSENVVCYELRKNNITIHNPCYQIRIVHLHNSSLRNTGNRINQKRSSTCRPEILLTDEEKVSVVITTYNNFQSLLCTIKSIQNQTYKNIEIIVVNHFSTESEYYNYDWTKNNLIIIHCEKNKTQNSKNTSSGGYQKNLGIEVSTGKYIAFCKDTDIWFPKKIQLQLNSMIKTDCKISSTDGLIGSGLYDSKLSYKKYNAEHYLDRLKVIFKNKNSTFLDNGFPKIWNLDFLNIHNCIVKSSVMITRYIIEKTGQFDTSQHDYDYNYWLRVLHYTNCVYIEDICFYYKS